MEGIWDVYFEEKTVGNCRICREGLYSHLSCRCSRVTEGICRLMLQCGEQMTDLGVLVPMGGGFGLEKKLPTKHLPQGQPHLLIKAPERKDERRFVPVWEGKPFEYLSDLPEACFARRGGTAGVVLK